MKKKKILRGFAVVGVLVALAVAGFVIWVEATCKRDFSSVPLPKIEASKDPEVVKRGSYVAHAIAHCSACHGNGEATNKHELPSNLDDLRGGYVMKAGPFGTFYPANLTSDPETGIAKLSDAELARVIRHGVGPKGGYDPLMAFAVGPMSDEDLVAVISYLRSLPPVKNVVPNDEWGFLAKALSSKFDPRMATAPKFVKEGVASKERGEYLVMGPALCNGCHTPHDPMKGFAEVGAPLSGGAQPDPDPTEPSFEIMAPNLTPDPETGVLAKFATDQDFIDRVRKVGMTAKGSPMPWDNFKRMTDDDLRSIFLYLSSVPKVRRATGPTRRPKGSFKG